MDDKREYTWMTLVEVMAVLECSRITVFGHVANGEIHRRNTSGQRRYLRSSVERLAESQKAHSA